MYFLLKNNYDLTRMLMDRYLINFIAIGAAIFYFYRSLPFFIPGSRLKILLKCILIGVGISVVLNLINFAAVDAWKKNVAADPSSCYKLRREEKDACLSWAAEGSSNETLCYEIQKVNGEGSKNTCIYNIARKKHNAELCKKIGNTEKFEGTQYNVDYCLMAIATDQADPKICDQIQRVSGPEFNDPSNAEDIASRERCYAESGVASKDKKWCEKAGKYKNLCLKNIK